MAEQLQVAARDTRGKHNSRRLRRSGGIPAILYGHGLAPVALAVSAEHLEAAMRHGSRLVELTGAVSRVGLHPRDAMGHLGDRRRPRRFHPHLRR